ncbi:hypothetical protein P3W85_28860 [Cupriavidus basilensis]|uniref:Lipoprotein n=1 Tax=Cupriavidus basilensis TaxID=68895 RepID=A0ABT6AWD5_9BURK|nr:hypothetical protein [Cupriavidus basilensis]MDF3836932.1 hypothetical protein [Cupriavidus basilensis]
MKFVLALIPATLLAAACASHTPADPQAASDANAQWQSLRADYSTCAKDQTDAGVAGAASPQDLVGTALKACQPRLDAMRTAFRQYLDAQMVSSHGRDSARQAADRVSRDTEAKTRNYLLRYVERERYNARLH